MSRSWHHNGTGNGRAPLQATHPYWRYGYWLKHGDRSIRDVRNRHWRHTENQKLREGRILYQGDLTKRSRRCAYDWW
jgi:hypothetical protein